MKLNKSNIKKCIKKGITLILIIFSVIGLHKVFYNYKWNSVQTEVEKRDKIQKSYDEDFLFQKPDGEPLVLVKPNYKETIFIIGGFRAAHFLDYFNKLHNEEKVNVIAPISGLTSWPFRYRNREWFYQEDMRNFFQFYNIYTANLPAKHRITVLSMSFGALSNTAIGARAIRKPDVMIYLSPLNTQLDYRAASPLMAWLSSKISILQHFVPFIIRSKNPKRAGMWDVVNDEKNKAAWNRYGTRVVNWEENLHQAVRVREAAKYMEETLISKVSGQKIIIMYGDDDLFFSQDGFNNLVQKFKAAGNTVEEIKLKDTGHMILNDNGGDNAKRIIIDAAKGK